MAGITSKLEDLGSRLQREALEREELLKQKDQLIKTQTAMEEAMEEKAKHAASLERAKNELEEEVAQLRHQLEELVELKQKESEMEEKERELQEQLEALEELVEKETESKEESMEAVRSLKDELEGKQHQVNSLKDELEDKRRQVEV